MWRTAITSLSMIVLLTVLTGIAYPLAMTGLAQLMFPSQANGSLVEQSGRIVGSRLIGQNFAGPGYFHGRPSAAGSDGYDAAASAGSNLGPTNQKLKDTAKENIEKIRTENQLPQAYSIPSDLVLASASGLDPHISPEAAYMQVERIARERGADPETIRALVAVHTENRLFDFLGEPRVNVLEMNIALENLAGK